MTLLQHHKDAVERELGYPLQWEDLPLKQDCRVACYLDESDPENEADWPRQHDWLAKRLNELHRVFVHRITQLDLDASEREGGLSLTAERRDDVPGAR